MDPEAVLGKLSSAFLHYGIEDRHVSTTILSNIDVSPLLEEKVSCDGLALFLGVVVCHGARSLVGP